MTRPDRAAHQSYEHRHREIDAESRSRFRELADLLGLDPELRTRFITAGLRAAQFHAADCALAEHELRSGHSWPAEDKESREEMQAGQWEAALAALREALAAARPEERPTEGAPEGGERKRKGVRYHPISTISKPPTS